MSARLALCLSARPREAAHRQISHSPKPMTRSFLPNGEHLPRAATRRKRESSTRGPKRVGTRRRNGVWIRCGSLASGDVGTVILQQEEDAMQKLVRPQLL